MFQVSFVLATLSVALGYSSGKSSLANGRASPLVRRETPTRRKLEKVRNYRLWAPEEIREGVYRWAEHYPDFIKVFTAQDAYGLPTAGTEKDCPFDEGVNGCLNYVYILQDFETYPEGSEESKRLPEVLWSGEVHGNEQVGPTSVLEATDLLLLAASCEAHPRLSLKPGPTDTDTEKKDLWREELSRAQVCRDELREVGIDDEQRKWLARLLSTRRIVVVPTANALGYFQKKREENGIDPNRDFPYQQQPKWCMQTIAARTLNEVFRQHMFQLSLTFHGGMEVVGYEWGAPKWEGHFSPDHVAQAGVGAAYSRYGGGWMTSKPYNNGPMNDLVYGVNGGMEDWAYAGSWDPERVIPCEPTTYGGYPKEKTIYDQSTLRVFNMLVETSNVKIPFAFLGSSLDVLNGDTEGNGHISRNLRLALLAAELVEPYLSVSSVSGMKIPDDIVPHAAHDNAYACQQTRGVILPVDTTEVALEWRVGGALTIDATEIWYGKWDDIGDSLDCWSQPSEEKLRNFIKLGTPMSATGGKGAFAASPKGISESVVFSAGIDLSEFTEGDMIFVVAVAMVDQDWKTQPNNVQPQLPPQAHIVNARTNATWYHEKENSIIQGRLQWFSRPLTIRLGNVPKVVELMERFPADGVVPKNDEDFPTPSFPPYSPGPPGGSHGGRMSFFTLVGLVLAGSVLIVGGRRVRSQFRSAKRSRVREFIEDESAMSPGLEGKKNGTYTDAPDVDEGNGHFELT